MNIVINRIQTELKKFWKLFKSTMFGNYKSRIGSSILGLFIFIGLVGPKIFPYDVTVIYENRLQQPSFIHFLGTDHLGRDVFRQLVAGTSDILIIAFLTAIISISVGVIIGMISGLVGGIVDRVLQIITNVFLTIPSLPVFLILAALFTISNSLSLALILSIFNWAGLSRAIRSQIISLRERDFIQICKVMNMSRTHVIFKELVPNIASYIIVNFIIAMKNAITGSVGIMLLGIAVFEPTNWGVMLVTAKDFGAMIVPKARLWLVSPIICISLFQFAVVMLSNGLDETLNPRLRRN